MASKEDADNRYTLDRVVRMVLSALSLIAFVALLRYLSDVLLPFAVAVAMAYILNPLVGVFERKTKRRGVAVAMTIGGLAIVGVALLAIGIPLIVSQASRFGDDLNRLKLDLTEAVSVNDSDSSTGTKKKTPQSIGEIESIPKDAPSAALGDADEVSKPVAKSTFGWTELREGLKLMRKEAAGKSRSARFKLLVDHVDGTYIGDALKRAIAFTQSQEFDAVLLDLAKRVAIGGWTVFSFAVNLLLGVTGLIIVLLYLIFLLLDYQDYVKGWRNLLPPSYRDRAIEFLTEFDVVLKRYFRGQAVVASIVGILFAVGFTLIGLPMAIPFGLFVGLLNMVPYLQLVALVPALLLAMLHAIEGNSSLTAAVLLTLAVFGVVQVVQDALITPRIMGKATGLRPVAILLGVFVWGKLLGFLGVVLAIPLTCLGIAYYRRYMMTLASAISTEEPAKPPAR